MIKIHYLEPDIELETVKQHNEENFEKEFLAHPDSTWYTTEDFQEAFNSGFISDLGYILITND